MMPVQLVHAAHYDGVQVDSIRCSGQVVSVGDHSWELLEACGDPDYREVVEYRRETVEVRGPEGIQRFELGIGSLVVVESWVYRPGPGRLTRLLTVTAGVLTDIRVTGRN